MNPAHIHQTHLFPAAESAPIPSWLRAPEAPPELKPLRPFQVATLDAVKASLRAGHRRVMLKAPTGAGKTVIAAHIIRSALDKGRRVMFVVDAISLVNQTVDKFWEAGIRSMGVTQADHEMTDLRQPVQVCSVQTLSRRSIPMVDLVIVDEAHVWYQLYGDWMGRPEWQAVPFIGLSATPYTKGLGKYYTDLVVASDTQSLIDQGLLSPFRVYAPSHPDLSDVRVVAGDYHVEDLSKAMDKAPLTADVVETWQKLAENRSTLCFAVDRAHARHLQEKFQAAGVPAAYMDANTEIDERREIGEKFARGEVKVVCNVGVLTKGIDWDVRCISLVRPTRSEMLFQQIIGRALRTAPGKEWALILDHSDTHAKLGFVTDVDARNAGLDDGKKKESAPKPRKERLPSECPSCHALRPAHARKCPACGFAPVKQNEVENEEGELGEFTGKKERFTKEQMTAFLGELMWVAQNKGYKPGWAGMKFKEKFGKFPRGLDASPWEPRPETLSWIKSRNIAWANRRQS